MWQGVVGERPGFDGLVGSNANGVIVGGFYGNGSRAGVVVDVRQITSKWSWCGEIVAKILG